LIQNSLAAGGPPERLLLHGPGGAGNTLSG